MARNLSVVIYRILSMNENFIALNAYNSLYGIKLKDIVTRVKNVQKLDSENEKKSIGEKIIILL